MQFQVVLRYCLIFILLPIFLAKAQKTEEKFAIKHYRIDLEHPSNIMLSELPKQMVLSAFYGILWAHYKEERSEKEVQYIKISKNQLLERLGIKAGIDSIGDQVNPDSTLNKRIEAYVSKNLNITEIILMFKEKYDTDGDLITTKPTSDDYNDREPKILFVTFLDEKGDAVASFDYLVLRANLMLENPECEYLDKKGKVKTFVDFFEERLFVIKQ